LEVVKYLVEEMSLEFPQIELSESIITAACVGVQPKVLEYILSQKSRFPNLEIPRSSVQWACARRKLELLKIFVSYRKNFPNFDWSVTNLLPAAIESGEEKTIEFVLDFESKWITRNAM